MVFQSTRPMRGATGTCTRADVPVLVSIHAPHAGRDRSSRRRRSLGGGFNPRAPCGARPHAVRLLIRLQSFQSTRPMRGATARRLHVFEDGNVSIHAPHAGRDCRMSVALLRTIVSIHAPHAGRDDSFPDSAQGRQSFNPRAPCGARHLDDYPLLEMNKFQSTRPMRGATSLAATIRGTP